MVGADHGPLVLSSATHRFCGFWSSSPAIFPVAWAGEDQSENWMDVARDYTEKWHHTQQIFDATSRTSTVMNRGLGHSCLDTFMRALLFTFRATRLSACKSSTWCQ